MNRIRVICVIRDIRIAFASSVSSPTMKLIVGLGNPWKKYEKTRHNVGFVVLNALHDALSQEEISAWSEEKKFHSEIAGCSIGPEKILLMKPTTFMNESGMAVEAVAHFYHIPARDIIVIHDDKDIPLGEIKTQTDRGPAGHNGVASIIQTLGTQDFTRVRVGIRGANEKKMNDLSKFVLGKFGLFEQAAMKRSIQGAVNQVLARINNPHI